MGGSLEPTTIAAGLNLDRAWLGLGAALGAALRNWARDALGLVVEHARSSGSTTLVILGDLFDRSTVLPDTADFAAKVLGSFPGIVLIAPGELDWFAASSPYAVQDWAPNTHIWTASEWSPSPLAPWVWGSAWTSPTGTAQRVPDTPGARLLVRAALNQAPAPSVGSGTAPLAVTTGANASEGALTVPPVVNDPRAEGGYTLTIRRNGNGTALDVARHSLPASPVTLIEVSVTGLATTEALEQALSSAAVGRHAALVRLTGELAPSVLLPGFGGTELPPGFNLDLDSLRFAELSADASDRSARAEFLRAIAQSRAGALERHQTSALGLAALDAAAQGR